MNCPPALSARARLVVRGNNDRIYLNEYTGSWGGLTGLPSATGMSPGAAVVGDELHLVVIGTNGRLYHGYVNTTTSSFSGWNGISGATPSAPTLTAD